MDYVEDFERHMHADMIATLREHVWHLRTTTIPFSRKTENFQSMNSTSYCFTACKTRSPDKS